MGLKSTEKCLKSMFRSTGKHFFLPARARSFLYAFWGISLTVHAKIEAFFVSPRLFTPLLHAFSYDFALIAFQCKADMIFYFAYGITWIPVNDTLIFANAISIFSCISIFLILPSGKNFALRLIEPGRLVAKRRRHKRRGKSNALRAEILSPTGKSLFKKLFL